jgi:hypothetical protein
MDTATAVSTGSSLLADRSDAMVILVLVIIAVILWIWKVVIPQKQSDAKLRDADKEIHMQNANTLAELSKVTTGIHDKTNQSHKTISAMMEVKEIELGAIGKIADFTKCDIREELSEARGVIRAIRVGATSD